MSQSVALVFVLLAAAAFFAAALAFAYLYIATKLGIAHEVQTQVNRWTDTERENIRQQEQRLANEDAALQVARWKETHTAEQRREAIKQSQAVTLGKVTEHIVPYLPEFAFNPKDVRFLGSPIDLIVFDGLSQGGVKEVVFVEVKTSSSNLTNRERLVRDAVRERRVKWVEFRPSQNSATPSQAAPVDMDALET